MVRAKGEGGIHWSQHRQRWVATWQGGKRYGRSQAEAAAKLKAMKAAAGRSEFRAVGQVLDWWADEHLPMRLANDQIAESTVHDYLHSVTLWRGLRKTRLDQLTPADVDRHLDRMRTVTTARGRTGYSASKRRGALVALRQAFKAAARARLIPPGRSAPEDATNPTVRIVEPPLVDAALALDVLAELDGDRDQRLILITLSLGLRVSEALGLTWDMIDFDAGTVRIRQQLKRTGQPPHRRWVLAATKGKNDVTLALPHIAADALREQRRVQREERLAAGQFWSDPIGGLVFRRADGQPVWSTSIANKVGDACERAGAPRMATHDFARHGYGTIMRMQGASLDDLREQYRHAQASTTQRYAHVLPEVRRRNADRIDQALG